MPVVHPPVERQGAVARGVDLPADRLDPGGDHLGVAHLRGDRSLLCGVHEDLLRDELPPAVARLAGAAHAVRGHAVLVRLTAERVPALHAAGEPPAVRPGLVTVLRAVLAGALPAASAAVRDADAGAVLPVGPGAVVHAAARAARLPDDVAGLPAVRDAGAAALAVVLPGAVVGAAAGAADLPDDVALRVAGGADAVAVLPVGPRAVHAVGEARLPDDVAGADVVLAAHAPAVDRLPGAVVRAAVDAARLTGRVAAAAVDRSAQAVRTEQPDLAVLREDAARARGALPARGDARAAAVHVGLLRIAESVRDAPGVALHARAPAVRVRLPRALLAAAGAAHLADDVAGHGAGRDARAPAVARLPDAALPVAGVAALADDVARARAAAPALAHAGRLVAAAEAGALDVGVAAVRGADAVQALPRAAAEHVDLVARLAERGFGVPGRGHASGADGVEGDAHGHRGQEEVESEAVADPILLVDHGLSCLRAMWVGLSTRAKPVLLFISLHPGLHLN